MAKSLDSARHPYIAGGFIGGCSRESLFWRQFPFKKLPRNVLDPAPLHSSSTATNLDQDYPSLIASTVPPLCAALVFELKVVPLVTPGVLSILQALPTMVNSAQPVNRSRRHHQKTRTGCHNCKRRRVKCDETRPNCQKCQIYGISCDYSAVQEQVRRSTDHAPDQDVSRINVSESSMALMDLGSRIDQTLKLASSSDEWLDTSHTAYGHSTTLKAFHHFAAVTSEISTIPKMERQLLESDVLRLAFRSPYLMHTILSVALTHLRQCSPDGRLYRVPEGHHCQNALTLYRKELSSPIGLHNMDSLISTCILLCASFFFTEKYSPADSWVFSSDPTALNWLLMQRGLGCLVAHTRPYLEKSVWHRPFFMESDDEHHTFDNHTPGRDGLHSGLANLCGIDETTTENDNPYHWPLRMLSPMLKLDPAKEPYKMTSFVPRMSSEFAGLLLQKDPKALVILSYWFTKMMRINRWWAHTRARSECVAICMYLENSDDSRILRLLEFPADSCGYLLRHVREEAVFEANFDLIGFF